MNILFSPDSQFKTKLTVEFKIYIRKEEMKLKSVELQLID